MVTKRWVFLSVLVVSGLILAGCGAPLAAGEAPEQVVVVGEMPVPQTGSEDVVEAVVEETNSGFGMGTSCPTDDPDLEVLATRHYCVLYPAGYDVSQPQPGVAVIHPPDYETYGLASVTGFVNISITPNAEGLTAPEISDTIVAEFFGTTDMPERVDTLLGGEPAVEIIGLPIQPLSWKVVAVHDGMVYTLTFGPLGEEFGASPNDMQALYDAAMASFTFLS